VSRLVFFAACVGILAFGAFARERKVAVVVEGGTAEEVAFVRKNAKGYAANGHPVTYEEKSGGAMRITVTDPNGAEVYAGGDKNAAIVAMVDTLTNLPVPGQLIGGGVALRKFKQYQKTLVMGKKAEGYALAPFKAALKSKKPAEVEEAQAILDSIEKAKARLADDIKEDLAAGDKGMALRDIRWYITTWPSERKTYEEDFKRLSADPEAVKAEKAWFAAQKKRR
jgi:hypothetical protein